MLNMYRVVRDKVADAEGGDGRGSRAVLAEEAKNRSICGFLDAARMGRRYDLAVLISVKS